MNICEALKKSRLFSGLNDPDLKQIATQVKIVKFENEELIFSQGDPANGFYTIASGAIRIYQLSQSGKEHLLHIFEEGESFGEAAAFGPGVFPASASAIQRTELVFIPISEFKKCLAKNPSLAISIIGSLARLMHMLVDQIESITLKDAGERLAKYLVGLMKKSKSATVTLPITKARLATNLNMTQETLSRLFSRFMAMKIIKVTGNKILIENHQELQRVTEKDLFS